MEPLLNGTKKKLLGRPAEQGPVVLLWIEHGDHGPSYNIRISSIRQENRHRDKSVKSIPATFNAVIEFSDVVDSKLLGRLTLWSVWWLYWAVMFFPELYIRKGAKKPQLTMVILMDADSMLLAARRCPCVVMIALTVVQPGLPSPSLANIAARRTWRVFCGKSDMAILPCSCGVCGTLRSSNTISVFPLFPPLLILLTE